MSDDENSAATDSTDKPFFAIDVEDLGDSTAPSVSPTSPPLAPMMMGTLAGAATPSEPQVQENMNPWGGATTQMTGDVASINGMFPLQVPAEAVKSAFRWGQFFLGLFLPWVVFIGTVIIAGSLDGNQPYPDFERSVSVSIEPNENGYYVQSVDRIQGETMDFQFDVAFNDTAWTNVYCWYHPNDAGYMERNGKVVEESNSPGSRSVQEVIGEYTESNQTVWFKINESHMPSTYDFNIYYFDEVANEAYWDEQYSSVSMLETLFFCGGPLLFIVSTIGAFVKGNKGLGIGLLCSIPMSFVMLPLLFVLLLLMFGF